MLTWDGGFESRSHLEQMLHHGVVEVNGEVFGELFDRHPYRRGEVLLQVGDTFVEALDHRVQLGAQTGRQNDDFQQVGSVTEGHERLGQLGIRDDGTLQDVEGRPVVLEAYD